MPAFTGTLNLNQVVGGVYNMIISQRVYADNVKGAYSKLMEASRVDGSLYGDQKLYYATNVLESREWGGDSESGNLLQTKRPPKPEVQAIVMDKFRQIDVTLDNYLTKQAWMDEGSFSTFNSVILAWTTDTQFIHDATTFNTYVGTTETEIGEQQYTINVADGDNEALVIAEALATLLVNLQDVSTRYNDYGFVRSYDEADLGVVWNAKVYTKIKKIDMPTIFHTEDLLNEFKQYVLPERYWGTPVTAANVASFSTLISVSGTDYTVRVSQDAYKVRSLVERTYTFGGKEKHIFPGDSIDVGITFHAGEAYVQNDDIAFKVIHNSSIPYMSAFSVATSFFNPRSLNENHYLTWGRNTLEYLKNYPLITAKRAAAAAGAAEA